MANQINNVSNLENQQIFTLKKVSKKVGEVTIKIGTSSYSLPGVDSSLLKANGLTFLSLPTVHAVFEGKNLITDPQLVKAAIRKLRQPAKKAASSKLVEVPPELAKALAEFSKANGARIVFDPKAGYKVQKVRGKRKSV